MLGRFHPANESRSLYGNVEPGGLPHQALSSGAGRVPWGVFVFQKEIEIRWRDLDGYAHVNHAVYVTYLEEARDEWLTSTLAGGTAGWDHFLVHLSIDYRRQLTQADDLVIASCEAAELGTSSVTTREELRTQGGDLVAEASAVVVALDPGTERSRPLTDRERSLLLP